MAVEGYKKEEILTSDSILIFPFNSMGPRVTPWSMPGKTRK